MSTLALLVRMAAEWCQRRDAPEGISATPVLSEGAQSTATSAYFFSGHQVSGAAKEKLSAVGGPLVVGADVNFYHPAWDPHIPPDAAGEKRVLGGVWATACRWRLPAPDPEEAEFVGLAGARHHGV